MWKKVDSVISEECVEENVALEILGVAQWMVGHSIKFISFYCFFSSAANFFPPNLREPDG